MQYFQGCSLHHSIHYVFSKTSDDTILVDSLSIFNITMMIMGNVILHESAFLYSLRCDKVILLFSTYLAALKIVKITVHVDELPK